MKASRNDNPPLIAETREEKFLAVLIEEQRHATKALRQISLVVQLALLILIASIALTICNAMNLI